MLFLVVIHVMCYSLTICEDMDIGLAVLGDLQKKCNFVILRKQEMIESLKALTSTQLRLIYAAMGVENPTEDMATKVDSIRIHLYDSPLANTMLSPFQTDISEALSLDDIAAMPLPSQLQLDGVEGLRSQDLTIMQFARELEGILEIFFFIQYHTYYLCNIQVTNLYNFNILYSFMNLWSCFCRTKCKIMNHIEDIIEKHIEDLRDTTGDYVVEPEEQGVEQLAVVNLSSEVDEDPSTPLLASNIVEQYLKLSGNTTKQKIEKNTTLDDVLGNTTHKMDGR